MNDVQDLLTGRDRRLIRTHLTTVDRRITQKLESARDRLKATAQSLIQGRGLDLETGRRVGDRKAVLTVLGKFSGLLALNQMLISQSI